MKKSEIFMYSLGGLVVTGFFLLLIFLVLFEVPDSNKDILNIVVGALIGSFTAVVGYFFGSSKGSKDKTQLLAKNKQDENNTTL
jgi:drug/metabolite transporter (DMT)-like permease